MHKFFANTQFLGKNVIFLPECHSTNDTAAELLNEKTQIEGTTIITAHQKRGKGQRGNSWESAPGKNAMFSLVLKPNFISPGSQFHLHLITTLAIYDALFPLLGKKLKIKWPNDIYYGHKKLGGILIENSIKGQRIEHSIIGVGLNVNQLSFTEERATSIFEIIGSEFEINDLIEKCIQQIEHKYLQLKGAELHLLNAQYLRRLYQFGETKSYSSAGKVFYGKIVGINDHGLIQIKEDEILHEFAFKEVSYL